MGDTVRGRRAGDQFDLQYVGWQTLHLHVEGLHHLKPGRVTPVSERRKAAVDSRPVALATSHAEDLTVGRVGRASVKGRTVTKALYAAPINVAVLSVIGRVQILLDRNRIRRCHHQLSVAIETRQGRRLDVDIHLCVLTSSDHSSIRRSARPDG